VTVPDLFGGWTAEQVGAAAEAAVRRALVGAVLLQAVLFVLTAIFVAWRPVRLALTPGGVKRHSVKRRAAELFLAKSLQATRERTGVLIFVSLAERMAEIIADEGIAAHAPPEVWDRAMAELAGGLGRGEAGAGFAAAVKLCGDVLAERFPADPTDNPNELPDAVMVLPRH
jgi:putative membrane protein